MLFQLLNFFISSLGFAIFFTNAFKPNRCTFLYIPTKCHGLCISRHFPKKLWRKNKQKTITVKTTRNYMQITKGQIDKITHLTIPFIGQNSIVHKSTISSFVHKQMTLPNFWKIFDTPHNNPFKCNWFINLLCDEACPIPSRLRPLKQLHVNTELLHNLVTEHYEGNDSPLHVRGKFAKRTDHSVNIR